MAAWSTAKTVMAPLVPVEVPEEGAQADGDRAKRGNPRSSRLPSARQLLTGLRPSSAATKKLAALVVAAAVMVCSGTLVARRIAEGVGAPDVNSAAAVPVPTRAPVAPHAVVEAPVEAAIAAPSNASPPLVEAQVPGPSPKRARAPKVAHVKLAMAHDSSGSNGVTLARQAVDALIAGDRPKALEHYRELSRSAPDREVYREAVRLLARSASGTPQ
jgi:hypothetical protein